MYFYLIRFSHFVITLKYFIHFFFSFPFSFLFYLRPLGIVLGSGLPYLSIRHINATIQDHGLSDIVKDQQKLYLTLATASALIWLIVFWILAGPRP